MTEPDSNHSVHYVNERFQRLRQYGTCLDNNVVMVRADGYLKPEHRDAHLGKQVRELARKIEQKHDMLRQRAGLPPTNFVNPDGLEQRPPDPPLTMPPPLP